MNSYRTAIESGTSSYQLGLLHKIFTAGSCFSEVIGNRLSSYKIVTAANSFGTLYHPNAIHKVLSYALSLQAPPEESYLKQHDVYFNYDFHSAFSAMDRPVLSKKIEETLHQAHHFLKDATCLMLTYGTAWAYERNDNGTMVANCHKMAGSNFSRLLYPAEKIQVSFTDLYKKIKAFNPGLSILLTVSPVRHTRDTLEGNCISKSILRTCCQTFVDNFPDVYYFPAFEIMMDDLRDYRFYKADLIHPNEQAEDYIWQIFTQKYYTSEALMFFKKWDFIRNALSHKPFHPASAGHQQFIRDVIRKLQELKSVVNVDKEMTYFANQLI